MRIAFAVCVSLFWTAVTLARVALDIIRHGTVKVFAKKERRERPAILLDGWNHDRVKLSTVSLHYVHTGERGRPLLLMLHGFPEFWYSWRHQLKHFKDGHWCVAVDMRGYNQSDKPAGVRNYAMPLLAQDVYELVKQLGYEQCTLMAHDWGGAVAWQVTRTYPQLVDKLVIANCPHPDVFAKFAQTSVNQFLKSWYMFFFQVPYIPEWFLSLSDCQAIEMLFTNPKAGGCKNPNAVSQEDIEAFKYVYTQPGALTGPINYYRAAMRAQLLKSSWGGKAAGGKVQPRTLIVWGTDDVALHSDMAELSAKQCDKAVVRFVEGASHWVQQDQPQVLNQIVRDFLAQ